MVDYGNALSGALRFCVEPKRWLPIFAIDALFVAAALSNVLTNASAFVGIMNATTEGFAAALSFVNLMLLLFSLFVVWSLVRLFIVGSLIHQSVKPKEYKKSCTVAKERYFSLLAVSIIVGLASYIAGIIPYIGWLVSIIVGLIFFYSMPAVVAGKHSFNDSLQESYRLFRDRFSEVLLSWLVIAIISGIIAVVFMIPVFMISFNLLIPELIAIGEGSTGIEFFSTILNAGWSLMPGIVVALAGIAISTAFSINAQTNFYLQIRKKKGIL